MKQVAFTILLFFGLTLFSQKAKPDEKIKIIYKDATAETDDYKVYIEDAIASAVQSKFKLRVFNKTNDFLLVKPAEIIFSAEGKTFPSSDRTFVVAPNDEARAVIDFKGSGMQLDKYNLDVKGIYKASGGGKITETPGFELPPNKNDFTTGNFNCTLKKNDLKTDKSVVRFECAYNGDGVGVIDTYKTVMVMPNKTDNPNSNKKIKVLVLEKGVKEDFTLIFNEVTGAGDMQKKPLQIKWGETFRESKLILLKGIMIPVEKDAAKTEEKNK